MNQPFPTEAPHLVFTWTKRTPGAVRLARAALRRALERFDLPPDVVDDALLAASELAANATEHAAGPYEITLRRAGTELICEVVDYDPRIPEIPRTWSGAPFAPRSEDRGGASQALLARLSERGRGLHIVDHLTGGAWGFYLPGDGTKAAWMAVPLPAQHRLPEP